MFNKLFIASRKSINRLVARIVPPHEVEDIVQDTYVRLCQASNKKQIRSPKSFMFTTARNLALDHLKRASVRLVDNIENWQEFETILTEEIKDEVYQKIEAHDEFAICCEAVRQLPTQCSKAFMLKKFYGYSQREIAEHLSISESTVEKRIATGTKHFFLFMRKFEQGVVKINQVNEKTGGFHE